MAGVLSRFSFATAPEKQLKQRKHCKKQNLYEVVTTRSPRGSIA